MKVSAVLFSTLCFTLAIQAAEPPSKPVQDPYENIERLTLENGLTVILAPSHQDTLTEVRVEVDVGYSNEQAPDWGVSHLLEHVLFRDKQLKDDMSYLQLIKEAGGSANGSTRWRMTDYYGSIRADKGLWLLEQFHKMLGRPDIKDDHVEKEKKTVQLERGEPGPITLSLGFDPAEYLTGKHLQKWKPTFWQREFGVSLNETYSLTEEQLSTLRLTTEQVKAHYENYYYPANMRLFVSGNFHRARTLAKIGETFGAMESRTGKKIPPLPQPKPKETPYAKVDVVNKTPYLYYGYKVWGLDAFEEEVLHSYTGYLAHRLMKQLRNERGETYSVRPTSTFYNGFGYLTLGMETPRNVFQQTLEKTQNLFKKKLSEEEVHEAVRLYLDRYLLAGQSASSMMSIARRLVAMHENHGVWQTPFKSLQGISPEKYNAVLEKHLKPKHTYQYLQSPPLFFRYDQYLLWMVSLASLFYFFRRKLTRPFLHDKIRWVRNVYYPPLKSYDIFFSVVAYFVCLHLLHFIGVHFFDLHWMQSSLVLGEYAAEVLKAAIIVGTFQFVLFMIPRKLMVMGDTLIVKSPSYYSRHIPLSEIRRASAVHPLSLLTKPHRCSHYFHWISPYFWRKGVCIELNNGKFMYFDMKNAENAVQELNRLLSQVEPSHSQNIAAA